MPGFVVAGGGVGRGVADGRGQGVLVLVEVVSTDAGAGVFEGGGLGPGLDAVAGAGGDLELLGVVAVEERAAVEVEAEAVVGGAGAVGGEAGGEVVGEAGRFDLDPVHGEVFLVAEAGFLEVDGAEDARDGRRLAEGRGGEGAEDEEQGGAHGPITCLSATGAVGVESDGVMIVRAEKKRYG